MNYSRKNLIERFRSEMMSKKTTFVWDNWTQICPKCGEWYLMPLEDSVSDDNDHRVYCSECNTMFEIEPVEVG